MNVETNHTPGFYKTVRSEMRLRNYNYKTIKRYLSCLRLFVTADKRMFYCVLTLVSGKVEQTGQ
jgi:hypothetical protein